MKLPPLNGVRAFESAARHQSFARAASELNLTATAISQHVRALEDWLGTALFIRHPRGVALTKEGQEFGSAVTHGLRHIALAAQRVAPTGEARPVSLACIASVATRWLIPRLPAFRAAHPDILFNVTYALDAETPEAAGVDLLIRHGCSPAMDAIRLLSAETRPTCSPDFLARNGPFASPSDLLNTELLHDETTAAWERWFANSGINMRPQDGLTFADFSLLIGSVIGGQGVALCPTALIATELAQGSLVTLFDLPADMDKAYWLIGAKNLSRPAIILREWCCSAVNRENAAVPAKFDT
ncbi:LysR substrate-binding domain-containing protein [Rhizobium tubonense]|uniref:Transcriptional regulator n=1 Tax=Rhizobium tubonense TaxID=484088 RepID=A0A2W4EZB2_9HYPH|nr:LysR substrate-binding domain-containing protein [Rhizobium tubonense]PZM15533.1 transcriptional regulator [Rhizobium tubonense]